MTNDDSLINEMLKMKTISMEESRNHKLKHVITKYLGSPDFNKPTIQKINWNNKDMLILCTDGLTNVLEQREIESVINRLIGSELETKILENSKKEIDLKRYVIF